VRQDCIDDCFKHPAPGCRTYECGRLKGLFGEDWGPKLCTDCNLRCGQTCWDVQGITKQLHERELKLFGGEVYVQHIRGKNITIRIKWDVAMGDLAGAMSTFADQIKNNLDPEKNGVGNAFRKFGADTEAAFKDIGEKMKDGFDPEKNGVKAAFEKFARDAESGLTDFLGKEFIDKMKDPYFWVDAVTILAQVGSALVSAAIIAGTLGAGTGLAIGLTMATQMVGPAMKMITDAATGKPIDALDIAQLAIACIPPVPGAGTAISAGIKTNLQYANYAASAGKLIVGAVKMGQAVPPGAVPGLPIPSTCLINCPPDKKLPDNIPPDEPPPCKAARTYNELMLEFKNLNPKLPPRQINPWIDAEEAKDKENCSKNVSTAAAKKEEKAAKVAKAAKEDEEDNPYGTSGLNDGEEEDNPYGTSGLNDGEEEDNPYGTSGLNEGDEEYDPYATSGFNEGEEEYDPYATSGLNEGDEEYDPYATSGLNEGEEESTTNDLVEKETESELYATTDLTKPPAYDNLKTYQVGDEVNYDNKVYRMTLYIGSYGYIPTLRPENWNLVSRIGEPPAYDNLKTYQAKDEVTYQGKAYRFKEFIGSYGYGPGSHPNAWIEISSSGVPIYDNFKTYQANDEVSFEGKTYRLKEFIGASGYTPKSHPQFWTEISLSGSSRRSKAKHITPEMRELHAIRKLNRISMYDHEPYLRRGGIDPIKISDREYKNPYTGDLAGISDQSVPRTKSGQLFSAQCYARNYPDLAKTLNNDRDKLRNWWVDKGFPGGEDADCGAFIPKLTPEEAAIDPAIRKQACSNGNRYWDEPSQTCDGFRLADGTPNRKHYECDDMDNFWETTGDPPFCNRTKHKDGRPKHPSLICKSSNNYWGWSDNYTRNTRARAHGYDGVCQEEKNVNGTLKTEADLCTTLDNYWTGISCDSTKNNDGFSKTEREMAQGGYPPTYAAMNAEIQRRNTTYAAQILEGDKQAIKNLLNAPFTLFKLRSNPSAIAELINESGYRVYPDMNTLLDYHPLFDGSIIPFINDSLLTYEGVVPSANLTEEQKKRNKQIKADDVYRKDTSKAPMFNFYKTYSTIGETVQYNNKLYKFKVSYPVQGWNPPDLPTAWELILAGSARPKKKMSMRQYAFL
jgi:hypothetical protein